MERITIELDDSTARKWQRISPKVKSVLERGFAKQIESVVRQEAELRFEELLEKAREEAEKNGLTEARLQELLHE